MPTPMKWRFASRESGYVREVPLHLSPELCCSPMVDDYYEEPGEEQFRVYVEYIQQKYPEQWKADAVDIYWSVDSMSGGIGETAPFQRSPGSYQPVDDFLTWFSWPVDSRTGARLDWFSLPVVNTRFEAWAKALNWTPSPLQPTCPLRSIVESRAGQWVGTRRGTRTAI